MNLENQCVSLELAKKLKELGIEQNSIFNWEYYDEQCYAIKYFPYSILPDNVNKFQLYSAFTSDELFEILFQQNYDHLEETGYLEITTEKVYRSTGDFYRITNNLTEHLIDSPKLADCLAELLILAKEQGLG